MLKSIHLKGVGPAPEMKLNLAPRLNVLTGDNGLGKSFLLDVAWFGLTGTWAGDQAWPLANQKDARITIGGFDAGTIADHPYSFAHQEWDQSHILVESHDPILVIYARVDGSACVAMDSLGPLPIDNPRREQRVRPGGTYSFEKTQIWNGLTHADGNVACAGLLADWASWQLKDAATAGGLFEKLVSTLRGLSPDPSAPLKPGPLTRYRINDVREIPTIDNGYSVTPVDLASAGVKRVLEIAYLLVWSWSEHRSRAALAHRPSQSQIILLVDEIETHLHPQWQRRLLPALLKVVAELTGVEVQMVVTTHSPLVMISLESEFTDQDRLHLLELKDREVELRTVPFENHGLVDDWLGSEVFGRVEPRSQHAAQVVRWAKAFMRGDKDELPKEMRSVKALDAELKKVLSDMDLFGPEWMVFREKQK